MTGDQQETPTEIAINKEDLDVLKILANFTEVPNKIKHKQLRIMLDKEKKGSPSTEFCKLLQSVPAEEVGEGLTDEHAILPVDQLGVNIHQHLSRVSRVGLGVANVVTFSTHSGDVFIYKPHSIQPVSESHSGYEPCTIPEDVVHMYTFSYLWSLLNVINGLWLDKLQQSTSDNRSSFIKSVTLVFSSNTFT